MLRLLIADSTDEFRTSLSEALSGQYEIRTCATGKQALALIRSETPDILVLDLMLPELDGISLLHALSDTQRHGAVLATTRFFSDYVTNHIGSLGVQYIMMKPCDLQATISRISDLKSGLGGRTDEKAGPKTLVSALLQALSIPVKLKGYEQCREAIILLERNPGMSITKELYPNVAAVFGISAAQVERSIRTAIAAGFEKGDRLKWQAYFPAGCTERPSNGVFLTTLADFLRLEHAEK